MGYNKTTRKIVKELRLYRTPKGKEPFAQWVSSLKDNIAKAQIKNRMNRLALGHVGDCKAVGEGVSELRIQHGPGYRVYFVELGSAVILLLMGGNKWTQEKDIQKAKQYWVDFQERLL